MGVGHRNYHEGHRIGVLGIGNNIIQIRGRWQRFPIFPLAFYMQEQRFICQVLGLIDGLSGRNAAGKVREQHPVFAGWLFVDYCLR